MMLSYSFKVLFANFANMWKVLLYRLIVLVLTLSLAIGLMLPTLTSVYNLIVDTGIFKNISDFLVGIFSGGVDLEFYANLFSENLTQIVSILVSNIGKLLLAYLYLIIVFAISRYLNGLSDYAVSDVVNSNMGAFAKFGFTTCMIRNIGKASKFTLAKMMFTVPFDVGIITFIVFLIISLLAPLGVFMPFVVMLIGVMIVAFRITLFSGWLPAVVSDGDSIFAGLKHGMKATMSRFWKIYSSVVILCFIVIFMGTLLTLFTCGVGFIVVFPTTILLNNIFYLVMYYGAEGKRYYIDHETIVTPKLLYDKENTISYKIRNDIFYGNSGVEDSNLDDAEKKEEHKSESD